MQSSCLPWDLCCLSWLQIMYLSSLKMPPIKCACCCCWLVSVWQVAFSLYCWSHWGVGAVILPVSGDYEADSLCPRTSALTAGDFQSSHHRSFTDSSGSASIPSSLIQKLRTAILIALRTVEVFNGLSCSRRIRACHPEESQCEETSHRMAGCSIFL